MPISVEEAKARYPEAETFKFGDTHELCSQLLSLVRTGKKRATCGALRGFRDSGESMPVVGRRDIALDWDGEPELVIETTEVTNCRFCDVDADFALAEGEDETLEGWQAGHQAHFERNGGWQPDMELVCERFTLVEDFAQSFK
ncbi:MAG: ASCH domain-containing protein [Verrucomicrobiota bacterium]